MEQLSAQVTIAHGYLNTTFPFHTEPQFEMTGGFVDGMGGIMSAAFAPLVTADERDEWESYSVANQAWIENSAYLERVHPSHRDALHGTIQDHEHDRKLQNEPQKQVYPEIFSYNNGLKVPLMYETGKLYAPLWQVSPADAGVVNADLLSDARIAELYDQMKASNLEAILSHSTDIGEMVSNHSHSNS